jgi:hypothetical protein
MTTTAAKTERLAELKWGQAASSAAAASVSLQELLVSGQFSATDPDRAEAVGAGWNASTPGSMQVIKSGALSITQWWVKVVGGAGGVAGVTALIGGVARSFVTEVGEPLTITLIATGGFLLSATALALAMFIAGDLIARGAATAGRHAGRAQVIASFLTATGALPAEKISLSDALVAFPKKIKVKTDLYPEWNLVTGVQGDANTSQVRLENGDWILIGDITGYSTV